jgi:ABC-type sugar transport system ATPase subunit
MTTVTLRGVSKTYRSNLLAINNLNLSINAGELVVVVGPSGSGKTTLLRLIAGLEAPSQGEILLGSEVVNALPAHKRNIAFMFQHAALFSHLTVAENLTWGSELREGQKQWSQWFAQWLIGVRYSPLGISDAHKIAQRMGIEHLLQRFPTQLSGGEQQRVAFGRAILRHPAVFLLDEPFSSLDAVTRAELRNNFQQNHSHEPVTTIYVTHDQSEALSLAERVVVMHQGIVQQIGTPREIYEHPANTFVAQFLGTPGMNLWTGRFEFKDQKFKFCSKLQPLLQFMLAQLPLGIKQNEQVFIGIRPEHVVLQPHEQGQCVVNRVEYLGDVSLLHVVNLRTQEPVLIAKMESEQARQLHNCRVQCELPAQSVHWFHGQTQQRITNEAKTSYN